MSETRQRIVETARRLFHEQGFAATGVATILREADVNSGSLYHYFANKEALLEAVLDSYLEGLQPELIAPIEAANDDPVAKLFALMALYREALLMTEFTYGCPIGNLALEVGSGQTAVTEKINENFAAWRAVVEGWTAAAAKRFLHPVDPSRLAALALAVMEGAVMQARTAKDIAPFDDAIAEFRSYIDLLEGEA